jgi:outer membrane protein assembly factor BamB
MRRPYRFALFACPAFVLGCLLLVHGVRDAKAQIVVAQPAQAAKAAGPVGADKGKAASIEYISFPADRDAQQLLEAVQQYIKEAKAENEKWDRICEAAQRVLDIKSDSFFEIEEEGDGEKKKSRVSVKVHANNLIGAFKPAGRQFYQLTYGPIAKQLLDEAIKDNYDRGKLADISQRYFHTTAGAEATLLLAGLYLDRGQYLEAAYAYERYLKRPDGATTATPRTLFKASVAFKRAADPANAAKAKKYWDEFAKVIPRDGLAFGSRTYSAEDLKAEFERPIEAGFSRANESFVSMRYGNAPHTALGDGGTVFLDPTFSLPMVFSRHEIEASSAGFDWVRQNLEVTMKRMAQQKNAAIIPGFFPVTAPGVLVFRNYGGIVCVAAQEGVVAGKVRKAGDLIWYSHNKRSLVSEATASEISLNNFWTFYQSVMPGILFENPLVGSLSHDGKHVYFVDDLSVPPPPQMNNPNMGGRVVQSDGGLNGISQPMLCAVNLEDGKRVWELGGTGGGNTTDEQDDATTNPLALMQGAYFLGPPLPVNGKLYVIFEKNGKLRLVCLDPDRRITAEDPISKSQIQNLPAILWSQRLGEPKDRLPNDSIRRFQCSYLAYADGVLVCGTNTGAVVGVDVMSRSLLWAHSYRTREGGADENEDDPNNPAIGRLRQRRVTQPGISPAVAQSRWRAAAPIIVNGRVIVTAYDARVINCIDLRTGNLIWTDAMDTADDLYVGGVMNDRVIVIGGKKARAYDVNYTPPDPKVKKATPVWDKLPIGVPCGHGVPAKNGLYYLPVAKSIDSDLPQIWAIDPVKGEVASKTTFRRRLSGGSDDAVPLGNLVFHEGQVFTQTPKEILAFPLIEIKRKAMDDLLRANPNDPAGLAARGELRLDDGKVTEAIADLRAANAGNPSDSVRMRIRDKLYQAYTELLRANFQAGKQYLEEYKTLLEVPLDSDDAMERQKLIDEQLRRKALYLSLMAKGMEKEGQLQEAFGYYREFATLGENKQLIPIDGELFGQVRPDVWARGRIDAMIRGAADPAAKKKLEGLVTAEWNAVKSKNDPAKLRDFVRIFGPYFPAGKEAQLSLAESLLATNNEEDAKEAEGHLVQLLADGSTDAVAGRASEALARSMIRKQLFEDAVALYTQIGTRFETTVIRDGKTGADFLADVLTDRRLLPFLEPTRTRDITSCKVERVDSMSNRQFANGFIIEPEGELLPFYNRFRLQVVMNNNGSPNWSLIVTDKTSNAVRCKFENLFPPVNYNIQPNQSWADVKLAQANGHIMLLHFGLMVYCVDLAEKKMLWQYNLVAGNGAAPPIRQQTTSADGEMTVMFEDGWMIRLGRSAVIRDGFAGILTRDGLVVLDLMTGQKLWQHAAVSPRSILFGDGKYLLLADAGEGKTPVGKVIRAVDGTTVDGIADFAKLATGSSRIKIIGRNLLLFDADKNKKSLRLYDPITAKNVWQKTYEANAKIVRCYDAETVAILQPDGKLEQIEPVSGAVTFSTKVDTAMFKDALSQSPSPMLLSDAERIYLVLNKSGANGARSNVYYGYSPIRTLPIDGPMICYSKTTGEELWATGRQFEGQQIVTDRFAELPCLIAANNSYDPKTGTQSCEVIAVDKVNGKIKIKDNRLSPNGPFQKLEHDPKTGKFELIRYDTKIVITPLDPAKP